MNDLLLVTVERYDGSYCVRVTETPPTRRRRPGMSWTPESSEQGTDLGQRLEHTHCRKFKDEDKAQRLADRVSDALDNGADLNLSHWNYTGI